MAKLAASQLRKQIERVTTKTTTRNHVTRLTRQSRSTFILIYATNYSNDREDPVLLFALSKKY